MRLLPAGGPWHDSDSFGVNGSQVCVLWRDPPYRPCSILVVEHCWWLESCRSVANVCVKSRTNRWNGSFLLETQSTFDFMNFHEGRQFTLNPASSSLHWVFDLLTPIQKKATPFFCRFHLVPTRILIEVFCLRSVPYDDELLNHLVQCGFKKVVNFSSTKCANSTFNIVWSISWK
jgi:hypothetical protein